LEFQDGGERRAKATPNCCGADPRNFAQGISDSEDASISFRERGVDQLKITGSFRCISRAIPA
jgi:hypothetical protein